MSEAAGGLSEALADALPVYEIPDDDLVGEVLVPAMNVSTSVRIGAGFFSSHCLAQIAPGLASFIASSSKPLELLVSPEISAEDRDAIDRGVSNPVGVIEQTATRLLADAQLSPSALVRHTLDCLSYLVASDRLELRFVLMQRGMYHKKMWLFYDGNAWGAVHGSGNATTRGLLVNGEQMTVDRPWMDGQSVTKRVELLVSQWDRQWNNENPNSLTLLAPQGLRFAGRHGNEMQVPTVRDFWDAWRADHEAGLEPDLPPNYRSAPAHVLQIPAGMEWRTGPFRHQGRAVDAYFEANGRGVLEIATGGGKTRTALICATETQERHQGPMLLLILVPSTPLMTQWADDLREFGIEPLLPSKWSPDSRRVRFEEVRAGLAGGERRTEVLIATNQLFAQDESLRALIDELAADTATMLVGDEMHNLGTPTFLNNLPERFDTRLGLSATPVRQYDPDGTDKLFDFFGQPVFDFSLADAIAAGCLTRYRYFLHEVRLADDEMNKYTELCEELKAAGFRLEDDGRTVVSNPKIERLLRERRAVLEQASGKIDQLELLLQEHGASNVQRTLIYTSAKPTILGSTRQIEEVNELLSRLGIISHQFTNAETSRADAKKLLDRFGQGDYQVLTAMKVLDEGIDIPQTDTAYLLASSTVYREWVQRRGRILRKAPGKEVATLHDFLVIPPDPGSDHGKAILRGELRRAEEFASLAVNEWSNDGPRQILSKYD
ncbi:MAG TPA: DEAD/DEAH box helicase family protein [Mycobacteriales bacterium]|nr:DEAD/DEAH box helicase family protein [Mycobacteriales bacterium]